MNKIKSLYLGRREFLRLCLASSLLGLSSCGRSSEFSIMRGINDALPEELIRSLPSNWRFENLKIITDGNPYNLNIQKRTDFLILDDGWISTLPANSFVEIESKQLLPRLSNQAILFLDNWELSSFSNC